MKRKMSLMAEVDEPTLAKWKQDFDIVTFGKASGNNDERIDEDAVLEHVRAHRPEVAVIELEPFTERVVDACLPELKLIACSRATPTNIDLDACAKRGVLVTNAPGRNANAVVEMTLGFVICLARFIPQTHHEIKCRRLTLPSGTPVDTKDILWQNSALTQNPYVLYRGIEIEGRTLGLVGFGIIGKMLTPKARALGLEVVTYDPFVSAEETAKYGASKTDTLDDLLRVSDFVSLHAKVTPETRGMFGRDQFAGMKPDAYFINTARGALVDYDALADALRRKAIAAAALDVYEYEPLYDDCPLLDLDNLIMTPHIGGATRDVTRHQSHFLDQAVSAHLAGKEPPHRVFPKK